MCNDFTAEQEEAALARLGVDRRGFAVLGAAGMLSACATSATSGSGAALTESMVDITTPDGTADAFFVHPGKGKHPGVIMWPDIAGLRDAYKIMARRLAESGYAVLVPNHYYRTGRAPFVTAMAEWRTPAGQEKLKPAIAAISTPGSLRDATAFVGWLDRQAAVDTKRGIGSQGYCMGGPYAVRTAGAVPSRVKAAASFHGGGLFTPAPDSPHRLFATSTASYLIAIAKNDDARAPTEKDELRKAAEAAGRPAEIEVYAGDHGWCTIDAPVYNQAEADRAWARLLALYSKL